jgi:hypothetical protein
MSHVDSSRGVHATASFAADGHCWTSQQRHPKSAGPRSGTRAGHLRDKCPGLQEAVSGAAYFGLKPSFFAWAKSFSAETLSPFFWKTRPRA